MNREQIADFKNWFDKFVAGFYGSDEYVNIHIKLKEDHSRRVCDEMLYLCDELNLNENQRLLAETIALFHDIGRFEQFAKYKTYNDTKSINHSILGVAVLQKENILSKLADDERLIIETAIRYHGEKELPADLSSDTLLLSKMIRDADKLDIFKVVIDGYIEKRNNPDKFKLEIELPDEPQYSPEVLDAILTGGRIDYRKLKTLNDMKLCILGWVYDINFTPTFERLKQRRYLETIFEFLPENEDISKTREKIFDYVQKRINSSP